jgi:hypothetical protein
LKLWLRRPLVHSIQYSADGEVLITEMMTNNAETTLATPPQRIKY